MKESINIEAAEVVLPCSDLEATLAFFTEQLAFRLDAIITADDPAAAVVSGHGLRLRLSREAEGAPGSLRLLCRDPDAIGDGARRLVAPNGTEVVLGEATPKLVIPPLRSSFVLNRADGSWQRGRAGMLYRDLIPDRQGGRFIASHIRIPEGGPVPDLVHFHRVRFQMIYCRRGWVKVVYEDQGAPVIMKAGDCVLQPPEIRHRVLESSPGLEVIEISCPARHETLADHQLTLPSPQQNSARLFAGQRFVFHQAEQALWRSSSLVGFETRDTGIAAATKELAAVRVHRSIAREARVALRHSGELLFYLVLEGALQLRLAELGVRTLEAGGCCVIPPRCDFTLDAPDRGLELLEVRLPGNGGNRSGNGS